MTVNRIEFEHGMPLGIVQLRALPLAVGRNMHDVALLRKLIQQQSVIDRELPDAGHVAGSDVTASDIIFDFITEVLQLKRLPIDRKPQVTAQVTPQQAVNHLPVGALDQVYFPMAVRLQRCLKVVKENPAADFHSLRLLVVVDGRNTDIKRMEYR